MTDEVSRQALAKRVAAGTLVGVPGPGTTLYPAWQFDTAHPPARIRPDVAALLAAWVEQAGSLDPYSVVSWSQTEQHEIHGLTPATDRSVDQFTSLATQPGASTR